MNTVRKTHKLRQKGSAFVVTLAVLAGLVALIAGIAASRASTNRGLWNRMQEQRARLMVTAGIQRAVAELESQDGNRATLADNWSTLGHSGAQMILVGTDGFRLQILDNCSRVNINIADQNQLKTLPFTSSQIDSLMDWREKGSAPRATGAKDEFYTALSHPYYTKQKPFDSVEELLLVKGFAPTVLYAPGGQASAEPTGSATGTILDDILTVDSVCADHDLNDQPKTDIRSATQVQMANLGVTNDIFSAIQSAQGSFRTIGDALLVQGMTKLAAHIILDNFTLGNGAARTGTINVNMAPLAVLETVPNLSPDQAQAIFQGQAHGYRSMGDLVDVTGMDFNSLSKTISHFSVGSRSFEVRVMGMAGATTDAMEAELILNDDGSVSVTRCVPQSYWDVRDRWGWDRSATEQVQIGVTS
jgi:general secretion pathway protein K